MTIAGICERYTICHETCRKILDKTEYKPEDFRLFNPNDVYQRKNTNPLERLRMLTSDAYQMIEMSLAMMVYKIRQELNGAESNDDYTAIITVKELTMFFAEVAPYVLQRAEEKNLIVKDEQSHSAKIFDMFKKEQGNKMSN
jgi:hypothetical protein